VVALGDRRIERMNAGVIPGLVAVDQCAGTPWFIPDAQGGATSVDSDWAPAVEGEREAAVIVELALDDDATLVGDEPGGCQPGASLPVQGESVLVWERAAGARVPLTVQLDGADRVRKQRAIAGEDGERAGLLVGERL
jgi:hypothetical protein